MSKKIKIIAVSTLGVMSILGLIAVNGASAYQGDMMKEGPNYTIERHEAMTNAFKNNDYTAWKNLIPNRSRVANVITQDNFAEFVQAHNLAQEGKIAEANLIRSKLGLGNHTMQGINSRFHRGMGNRQHMD